MTCNGAQESRTYIWRTHVMTIPLKNAENMQKKDNFDRPRPFLSEDLMKEYGRLPVDANHIFKQQQQSE